MYINKRLFAVALPLLVFASINGNESNDNLASDTTLLINEISITAIKQGDDLKREAVTSTALQLPEIEKLNIESLKGISTLTPNFHMPDYGSRITSSIYVRGIGARMDQPVVGLNIDNVPYMNKDNFDFNISDIAKIEILRGPQSTLYGRNTIGGIINIYTLSPLNYQGIRINAEYSSGNTWKVGASYYTKIKDDLGVSVGGAYNATDGFFTNEYNGKKCDWEKSGNTKAKVVWNPENLYLENTFVLTAGKQGGYPYKLIDTGKIAYNDTCFYKRFSVSDGLTLKWESNDISYSSITSYQYLDDNMTLDQDFRPVSYFTLTQAKREHAVTEDFITKGKYKNYSWLGGLFAFYKGYSMDAPVSFLDDGISNLIEKHRNEINPDYPIRFRDRNFLLNSEFNCRTVGVATYHNSKITLSNWELNAGLRLDFEHARLDYHSYCSTTYDIFDHYNHKPEEMKIYSTRALNIDETGGLSQNFLQLLPKISAIYSIPSFKTFNIYATAAKGYKAGGYNTQMFSDVLQQKVMQDMGLAAKYSVNEIVSYKPEISWNFELGSHFQTDDNKLSAEATLFYIYVKDQQLTVFPDGLTTGRIMTNAGKSRSFGSEVAVSYNPLKSLSLNASYGYTNAKFIKFNNGKEDFSDNYVPYAPQNTIFAGATYSIDLKCSWLNAIILDANVRATGKIYWNEANSIYNVETGKEEAFYQPLYALMGCSVSFKGKNYNLKLWGENITDTEYNTFYFMSVGNSFVQRGKKATFGVTLRINI